MKLKPISPKNNAAARSLGLMLLKRLLKKIMLKSAKIAVFKVGTIIADTIEAAVSCFFFNTLETNPATIPAIVVLSKQAKIVPIGLIEKKIEIVLGENKVNTPEINPKNPPTTGPYNNAPRAMIITEKLRFTDQPGMTI